MQRLRALILIVGLVLLSAVRVEACSRGIAERVSFDGFERVTHLSTSGMNLWVGITNRSCWRVVVADAEVDVFVGGTKRLTLSIRDKVVVPRRSSGEVLVPIRLSSHSMLSIVGLVRRLAKGEREDITIAYRVRVGTRLFKRKLVGEGVSIETMLGQLGLTDSELGDLNRLLD